MFPAPRTPGEAMFAPSAGTAPSMLSSLTSWPMITEEPFPCTRDRHLVYGSPAMPYTLHACWSEVPCMEWRFAVRNLMAVAEREVAGITEENHACVRTYQRAPDKITSASYDFRPGEIPPVPVKKIIIRLTMAILLIVLLASI